MRKVLAVGCCAVYLAFGFSAGAVHVHESADHHAEMRGLHVDHAHLGHPAAHLERGSPDGGDARIDTRRADRHSEDALYLATPAARPLDSNLRVMAATVFVGAMMDPPSTRSDRAEDRPNQLRGPPRRDPTRSRAPPA